MKLRTRPAATPNRAGSRHNPARAAKEKASPIIVGDSSSSSGDELSFEGAVESRVVARLNSSPTRRVTRSTTAKSPVSPKRGLAPLLRTPTKRRRTGFRSSQPHRGNATRTAPITSGTPTGVIPNWPTLPCEVLVSIFEFASQPINSQWLVDVACLCKAFKQPALIALYESPPICNAQQAHQLVELLSTESENNYRYKIKSLSLDVGSVIAPVYHGAHLDFVTMFRNVPSVSDIRIFHQKDLPPYRQLSENIRWAYNDSLLEGLGVNTRDPSQSLRLRSWDWNRRMLRKMSLSQVTELHQNRPFQSLRRVGFVNFQAPSLFSSRKLDKIEEETMDRESAEELAACIAALPSLEHLMFESSTCVNGLLLPLLPRMLKSLELTNCGEVRSDELCSFLQSHGRHLETLNLQHNQALSLSFLPILGTASPKLRELKVNLTYFRVYEELTGDSDPCYEDLLTVDEVPNWPSTLEVIEIENMRQWTTEAATMFLKSLADSSSKLPMLRRLSLKARLPKVSWRDRSLIRDLWVDKLEKIYLKPWVPPKDYRSLKDFQRLFAPPQDVEGQKQKQQDSSSKMASRRSTRLADSAPGSPSGRKRATRISYKDPDTDEDESTDSNSFISMKKQRRRLEDSSSDSSSDSTDDGLSDVSDIDATARDTPEHKAHSYFIQGLCNVVDITIDGQKPTEMQFFMDDFMDDTEGEESEWDGQDPEDGAGYAW
ncbi:hypothetical protein MKZ38_004529 [Zalerion maritima]|uniref:Uncharacterized protein n=1 Tax=Zalerion maritima TaxID=339359 RepID=A0AAD5WQW5_9PEZI|nr:hypothetical protein MKZ38_004529 [Zalerion maritima]